MVVEWNVISIWWIDFWTIFSKNGNAIITLILFSNFLFCFASQFVHHHYSCCCCCWSHYHQNRIKSFACVFFDNQCIDALFNIVFTVLSHSGLYSRLFTKQQHNNSIPFCLVNFDHHFFLLFSWSHCNVKMWDAFILANFTSIHSLKYLIDSFEKLSNFLLSVQLYCFEIILQILVKIIKQ